MSENESDPYDLDSGPDLAVSVAAVPGPGTGETDGGGEDADAPVYAVGVGPGNLEHLTPRGRQATREAGVIVGFEMAVDLVADETDINLLTCGYTDEVDTLAEFGRHIAAGDRGTVVLMGDPNHSGYQFLGKAQRTAERPVWATSGTSSLQTAASRARTPMENTRFVTLHRSGSLDAGLDRLAEVVGERYLLVPPRPFNWMPGDVVEFPLDSDADASLNVLVLERLTYDDERITRTTLGGLRDSADESGPDLTPYPDLSVLAVRAPVDAAD